MNLEYNLNMRFNQSQLKTKRITIKDKIFLVHENENTQHNIVKKQNINIFMDASIMSLGRIASIIANIINNKYDVDISGHNKHTYRIILFNCDKYILTGNKSATKTYYKYTGYAGGLKEIKFDTLYDKNPRTAFEQVISRMLNKNRTRQTRLNNISYFPGEAPANIKANNNPIQTTVDRIINEWLSKRSQNAN